MPTSGVAMTAISVGLGYQERSGKPVAIGLAMLPQTGTGMKDRDVLDSAAAVSGERAAKMRTAVTRGGGRIVLPNHQVLDAIEIGLIPATDPASLHRCHATNEQDTGGGYLRLVCLIGPIAHDGLGDQAAEHHTPEQPDRYFHRLFPPTARQGLHTGVVP